MFYVPTKNLNVAFMRPQPTGNLERTISYNRINPYDLFNGGIIAGTVSTESAPTEGATVVLYESIADCPVAETTTDAAGYFQFSNLDRNLWYHLIVKNANPEWEYRISSRRTPI